MASKQQRQLVDIARAAVYVAQEAQSVPMLIENFRLFKSVLGQSPALQSLLTDPSIAFDQRFEALKNVLGSEFRAEAINAIGILMQRHLLIAYDAFLEAADQAARELANYYECRVLSAVELTEQTKQLLEQALSKRLNGAVRLTYQIDPSVLGGLEVICGDWRYRSTIQSKLQQLSQHLVMSR